jgi:hypothetical protein
VYIYIYIYANVSTDTWFEALKKKHTLKLVFKAAWHCQKRIKKNKNVHRGPRNRSSTNGK